MNNNGTIETSDPNNSEIIQQNNYYPFGLEFQGTNYHITPQENQYKYNGKELQSDFGLNWYDYGARFYDPLVARFSILDPLSQKTMGINPYSYCKNDPINYVDPTGMSAEQTKTINSTFINSDGDVIEHRDDDDHNVYLVSDEEEWKKNGKKKDNLPIVGFEDWRKKYNICDQYVYYNPRDDDEYNGQYMIPEDAYDYSQDPIDGKFSEDMAYYFHGGPWYESGKRFNQLLWRDLSGSSKSTLAEATLDIVTAGTAGKATGWIIRKTFNSIPTALRLKFIKAISKGIVGPKNQVGIVKLTATEIAEKGLEGYTHKLKILSAGGSHYRIYGRMGTKGHIVFDKILNEK